MSIDSAAPAGPSPTGPASPTKAPRWFGFSLLALLVLGLLVRLLQLHDCWQNNPLSRVPLNDAQVYWDWAAALAAGDWGGEAPFFSAPLYPYLLGLLRFMGGGLVAAYLVQTLLHLATAFLLAHIGRVQLQPLAGLGGALLFLLLRDPAAYSQRILNPALQLLLVTLSWWAMRRAVASPAGARHLLAGAILGVTCLAAPPFQLALLLYVGWLVLRGGRRFPTAALQTAAAALLCIAPATLHNFAVSREFIPIQAASGITYYFGNAPGSRGLITRVPEVHVERGAMHEQAARAYRQATGEDGSWSAISSFFRDKGLAYLKEDPVRGVVLTLKKMYWFLTGRAFGDIYAPQIEVALGLHPWLRFSPLALAWLIPAALWALLARGVRRSVLEWCLLLPPFLTVALFWYSPRFRMPIAPLVCVWAAWFVVDSARRFPLRSCILRLAAAFVPPLLLTAVNGKSFDPVAKLEPIVLTGTGFALEEEGQSDQALDYYRRALERNPEWVDGQIRLVYLLNKQGRHQEVVDHLTRALAPPHAALLMNLGLALAETGRLDQAVSSLQQALQRDPDLLEGWVTLGRVLTEQERFPEAQAAYQQALAREPKLASALRGRQQLQTALERNSRLQALQQQVVANPTDLDLRRRLADLYLKNRHWQEANRELTYLLRADPNSAALHNKLGFALSQLDQLEAAEREFRRALELSPGFWRARLHLAEVLEQRGDSEAAREEYERTLRQAQERGEPESVREIEARLRALE